MSKHQNISFGVDGVQITWPVTSNGPVAARSFSCHACHMQSRHFGWTHAHHTKFCVAVLHDITARLVLVSRTGPLTQPLAASVIPTTWHAATVTNCVLTCSDANSTSSTAQIISILRNPNVRSRTHNSPSSHVSLAILQFLRQIFLPKRSYVFMFYSPKTVSENHKNCIHCSVQPAAHTVQYSKLHTVQYSQLHTVQYSQLHTVQYSKLHTVLYSKLHTVLYSKLHTVLYSKLHTVLYSKLHTLFSTANSLPNKTHLLFVSVTISVTLCHCAKLTRR